MHIGDTNKSRPIMRFRKHLKSLDTSSREELSELFDRAAWTLGFSSLSTAPKAAMDTEAAVVLVAYLVSQPELRLARFLSVLLNWLQARHHLLHAAKLLKMAQAAEAALGEMPTLRLALHVLRKVDPKKFQNFKPDPLSKPFYPEPRLAALVDQKLKKEGLYLDLPTKAGFHVPKSAFQPRTSDLLSEEALLKIIEQLRLRLLHGASWRSDAVLLLRDHPAMTASELSDTLMLSYEPAHRLVSEVSRYRSLGFPLSATGSEA
jgi:hypothetical protein